MRRVVALTLYTTLCTLLLASAIILCVFACFFHHQYRQSEVFILLNLSTYQLLGFFLM